MSDTEGGILTCRNTCWIVGALLGLVAFLLIMGSSVLWGLVLGIVLAVAIAIALQRLFCADVGAAAHAIAEPGGPAASASGDGADVMAQAEAQARAEMAEKHGAATPTGAAATAAMGGAAAAAGAAATADIGSKPHAQEPAQEPAAVEETPPAAPEAAPAAESVSTTPDYDGDGVQEGTAEGKRPEALTGARGGQADDLKLIKGVGPKLEQLCNELGFYHFDQIANWTADEVAWVDANLKGFKGRVSRDNWVAQAKTLASGGETEFSKRAEDSGMYEE